MDFKNHFAAQESKLAAELMQIRSSTHHAGNKGTKAEAAFRQFLGAHLPRTIEVGHGEVIDFNGHQAGAVGGEHQVDVILVTDEHPRFSKIEDPGTYVIDGVAAGAEVKLSLQLGDFETIMKQAAAFKNLSVNLKYGDQVVSSSEGDLNRFVNSLPYFLFAFESHSPMSSIVSRVEKITKEQDYDSLKNIDAIFTLDRGGAINLGDGTGIFRAQNPVTGEDAQGWVIFENSPAILMLSWLSSITIKVKRNRSIMLDYYLKSI